MSANPIPLLFQHWRFVFTNAWTETRHRYAGTTIGIFWHVIQPLSTIALFSFIFAGLFPSRPGAGGGVNPALYITAGMLPWLAFSDCINRCTTSLVDNAHYLRKLSLPEILFVARTATTAAVMMLISVGLIAITALLFGQMPHWSWLTVPFAALLMIAFGFGIGLILSPLQVFLRDTAQAVGVLVQFWMWITPVILSEDVMPKALQHIQIVNPGYWYVKAVRDPFLTGEATGLTNWLVILVLPAITIFLGTALLARVRSDIRDQL